MDTDVNKALIWRLVDEAWNGANLAVLDALTANPAAYRTAITDLRIAYPDLHISLPYRKFVRWYSGPFCETDERKSFTVGCFSVEVGKSFLCFGGLAYPISCKSTKILPSTYFLYGSESML